MTLQRKQYLSVKAKLTKEELERLYLKEKKSPEAIGEIYGAPGEVIRNWMKRQGVKILGPIHFQKDRPAKEELEKLYFQEKKSSVVIGKIYGVHSRTIRTWMKEYGIQRLGNAYLKKGQSATWNKGKTRTPEHRAKLSAALKAKYKDGVRPPNFGKGRIRFNCQVCGIEVFDRPCRRRRTCSKECKNEWCSMMRGEKSWHFKGGDTATKQRQRGWSEYRKWRRAVLRRHKRICVCCEQRVGRGGRITAHHLHGWADHPELRFDPENGVALCWPCHQAFHREGSWRHATSEIFCEWLKTKKEQSLSTGQS